MTPAAEHEIALIERLTAGKEVKESQTLARLLDRFATAGWIVRSNRRDCWRLNTASRQELTNRLQQLWPTRDQDLSLLHCAGLTSEKSASLAHLATLRRAFSLVRTFVNNHTWATVFGAGPKRPAWRRPDEGVTLTHDAMSRIRPNKGLAYQVNDLVLRLDHVAAVLTETGIPQRSLLAGGRFQGVLPSAIVTVENLGAFVDASVPDDIMLIYSPGFDLRAAEQIVRKLPSVAWVHFGDLDPEGLQIWAALKRAAERDCQLFVPVFAGEYLDLAQKPDVPWGAIPEHGVFDFLRRTGKGIFQEAFVLDERLHAELARHS